MWSRSGISSNPPFGTRMSSLTSSSHLSIFITALLTLIFTGTSSIVEGRIRRDLPLSMDKEMFPPQEFDEEAPICLAEREPCGFYSFSLDGKAPLKWIKSWCRCSSTHECVYERTDMRMRVYRQTCVPKGVVEEDGGEQQNLVNTEGEADNQQNQTSAPTPHRHHSHHHHHHHNSRHVRRANRRIIRRLRAITLVD